MTVQYDIENERAVIVAALRDPEARRIVTGAASPDDFLGGRFRAIFRALQECQRKDLEPDKDAIAVHCGGEDFGGLEYLGRLLELEPPKNLEYHLSRLRRDAARARLSKRVLPDLEKMLLDRGIEYEECLRALVEATDMLRIRSGGQENVADLWSAHLDRRCSGEVRFQSVGYPELDKVLIDGYAKGEVSLIAARTGNGKTTVVADTVRRLLTQRRKPRICVLPLEIGQLRFLDKLVSSATEVPSLKLRKEPEDLTLAERERLKKVVRKMAGTDDRLVVLDNPFFKLPEWNNQTAMSTLEGILAEGKYDIVFIDLFQRCLTDIRPGQIETSLVRVQHLAKQYDVHLCLVHQISRKVEERKDKRPNLSDLKGSGGYEEIPDLVLLLHRPKAYKRFRPNDEVEFQVAKQRDYEAGVTLVGDFLPGVSRIENVRLPEGDGSDTEEGEVEEAEPLTDGSVY